MMKLGKAERRDKKTSKRKNGMKVSGRSCFIIQRILKERADKIQKEKSKYN